MCTARWVLGEKAGSRVTQTSPGKGTRAPARQRLSFRVRRKEKWFDEWLSTRGSISEQSILPHGSLCQSPYQYRTVLRDSSLRRGLACRPRIRQVPPTFYFTNCLGNPWPSPFHTNSRMFLSTSMHSGQNFQQRQLSLFFPSTTT